MSMICNEENEQNKKRRCDRNMRFIKVRGGKTECWNVVNATLGLTDRGIQARFSHFWGFFPFPACSVQDQKCDHYFYSIS